MLDITSFKNPKIKLIQSLDKAKDRRKEGLYIIEGIREISLAQQSGVELINLFICPEIYFPSKDYPINEFAETFAVSQEVFSKIAYRESTGGILALAKLSVNSLSKIPLVSNGLYLILEKVEKPGNIGAILRTADAANLDGVIICDPATDFYNPNVVRSSLGCLFTVPIASASNEEVLSWLNKNNINSYAASLQSSKNYIECDYTKATAFLMGSEAEGLSKFWENNSKEKIIIPMRGKIDSMNVSTAAAVLVFEALRQRVN